LAFVFALVVPALWAGFSPCSAAPVIDQIAGSAATPATGTFTFAGGGVGTFDPGTAVSSLNTGMVSQGIANASFTPLVFNDVTPGSNIYNIGDVTKTLTFANASTATFSLTGLVGTIDATGHFINILGSEILTTNGNAANFNLSPFLASGVFTMTFSNSMVNFQDRLQNGGATVVSQGSQFTQNAAGTSPGPAVPEPGTLALWTTLAAAGLIIRRRRAG
jgi:hypothetical protein